MEIDKIIEHLEKAIGYFDDKQGLSEERSMLEDCLSKVKRHDISKLEPFNKKERELIDEKRELKALISYRNRSSNVSMKAIKGIYERYVKHKEKINQYASLGEVCPDCTAQGNWVVCVGSNPDGIYANMAYDCNFCGCKWEGL